MREAAEETMLDVVLDEVEDLAAVMPPAEHERWCGPLRLSAPEAAR